MSIDLSPLRIVDPIPTLDQFGGIITPGLGAPAQQVDRMGDRWSWSYSTPQVDMEPEGRRWAALLVRARKTRGRMPIVQKDFIVGACGTPAIRTATATGRFLPLKGLTPGYAIREGQWLNYVAGGRPFLDLIVAPAIASAAGEATVEIANLLRAPLGVDAAINLAKPVIDGLLTGVAEWSIPVDGVTSFSFTIAEDA